MALCEHTARFELKDLWPWRYAAVGRVAFRRDYAGHFDPGARTAVSAIGGGVDIIARSDDDRPMKYPGGKGKCYQRLINLMPPHSTYIETHLGGGAVLRHKRPATVTIGIDVDASVVEAWQAPDLAGYTVVQADAVAFLREYALTDEVLIYSDPPYLPDCRRNPKIYRHEYSRQDHLKLLDVLVTLPCMVMVSGYNSTLYETRLTGWRKETFLAKTHVDVREECVWMNFPPPTTLHDPSFLGDTFRDRQTVRRRHDRIVDKFDRMDTVERGHVLAMLNSRFGRQEVAR